MGEEPVNIDVYDRIASRFAEAIEDNAYNACHERPATLALLPDVAGARVLDAGCGPGVYARILAERGANVVGIDASEEMMREAAARVPPSVTLRRASLTEPLDFPDGSFDLVLSPLVLDSIRDWRPVFRELARVLAPRGWFVFSVGHPQADFAFSTSGRYFDVERIDGPWPSFGVVMPSWRRPLNEILAPLHDAGFVLDRIVETEPGEELLRRFPEKHAKLQLRPSFLHVRARRG